MNSFSPEMRQEYIREFAFPAGEGESFCELSVYVPTLWRNRTPSLLVIATQNPEEVHSILNHAGAISWLTMAYLASAEINPDPSKVLWVFHWHPTKECRFERMQQITFELEPKTTHVPGGGTILSFPGLGPDTGFNPRTIHRFQIEDAFGRTFSEMGMPARRGWK